MRGTYLTPMLLSVHHERNYLEGPPEQITEQYRVTPNILTNRMNTPEQRLRALPVFILPGYFIRTWRIYT